MQTKNQKKFGVVHLGIALVLSIFIFSCSKTGQLDVKPLEEIATTPGNNSAANTYQSQQLWGLEETVWVPCANDGNGEYVQLNGYVHFNYQTAINNNHFTLVTHTNLNEVSGVGLTTGDHYVGIGGGLQNYIGSIINGQWTSGGSTNFKFVGAGPGNNLTITFNARIIVNANGEVSTQLQDANYSCD